MDLDRDEIVVSMRTLVRTKSERRYQLRNGIGHSTENLDDHSPVNHCSHAYKK